MTRCLFAIEDTIPLTPNFTGGASALAYSHLELLAHAGVEVHLVIFCRELPSSRFQAYTERHTSAWNQVKDWCTEYHLVRATYPSKASGRLQKLTKRLFTLSPYMHIIDGVQDDLAVLFDNINPDLIWAEHLFPASFFHRLWPNEALVYSHHDWYWKVKSFRTNAFYKRLKFLLITRRYEQQLVRQVNACVSASASEVGDMIQLGVKHASYFPTLYHPTPPPAKLVPEQPRIVHLGGMQTTANRIGLKRFLRVTWPIIKSHFPSPPPLWIIGSLDGADQELHQLLDQSSALCTGYVEDLDTVLRPYDLHIIPWEHNTGTRTRIPLMLSYGQVVVSTYASAACLPELKHNDNAVLVRNLQDMAHEICDLLADDVRRKQIGLAGHELFLSNYTREAVQPRFDKFIADILNNGIHKNGFVM